MNIKANYCLLDAAKMGPAIEESKKINPDHRSLFKETKDPFLQHYVPYLFQSEQDSSFMDWLGEHGWGNSWGIFIRTRISFEELYKHLRKFIVVKTENGKEYYFRFYDPRVLRTFLPSCSEKQLIEFFGPVKSFVMEDADPKMMLVFTLINGNQLMQQRIEANASLVEMEN